MFVRFQGQKYNQTTDWWSFGVLLYEMLVGQTPFSGCDEDALFWSICNEIPWYPFYISDEAINILTKVSVLCSKIDFVVFILFFWIINGNENFIHLIIQKFLDKNANTRLGSPSSPHGEINENAFFREIDWKKLERRQLESPFKPEIVRKLFYIKQSKKQQINTK